MGADFKFDEKTWAAVDKAKDECIKKQEEGKGGSGMLIFKALAG